MPQQSSLPTVLIVDDSPVNLFLLEGQLKNDYNIITASNGPDAIKLALSENQPDIILLDVIMPEMDGFQVCSTLKKTPQTSGIPIIFITSVDEDARETHGLKLGAADYITRPFNIEIVRSRINNHIDLKKNRDALEHAISQLKEKERYLETIMSTIQNGVVVSDPDTCHILDVNPFFCDMVDAKRSDLLGKDFRDFLGCGEIHETETDKNNDYRDHSMFNTCDSDIIHTRRWFKTTQLGDKEVLVQSISDITNIKELLKQQDINIYQAKCIMEVIHNPPERNVNLRDDLNIFINYCAVSSLKEGGDHFFVKTISDADSHSKKTFMSIKDQSGHHVGCILRSITTDLIHNSIIHKNFRLPLDQMITRLNQEVSKTKVFTLEEYFTSINFMIDHETSQLHFVSCAHPPFFFIRGDKVSMLARPGHPGTNLPIPMPDYQFEKGEHTLLAGDKFIVFTDGMADVPIKSGKFSLTYDEMVNQLELILKKGHTSITDIMTQFIDWISLESKGLFVSRSESDDPRIKRINSTGDDITLIWFEVESTKQAIEKTFSPRSIQDLDRSLHQIIKEIITTCEKKGYGISAQMLRIALTEMILNAWKHGNKEEPDRPITVRVRYANDIHLEVIDEGDGFDYANVPDPTAPENILKTTGRGIYMIRYAASEVFWKDKGRHIIAVFQRKHDPSTSEVNHYNDIHLW